jgi:hypothetical protein
MRFVGGLPAYPQPPSKKATKRNILAPGRRSLNREAFSAVRFRAAGGGVLRVFVMALMLFMAIADEGRTVPQRSRIARGALAAMVRRTVVRQSSASSAATGSYICFKMCPQMCGCEKENSSQNAGVPEVR